jgi:glycosyltransferase involved in cell wall biosynthesis
MQSKIVFVKSLLTAFGGAENTVVLLACELRRRGHEVVFITRPPVNKSHPYFIALRNAGIPVIAPPNLRRNRMVQWLGWLLRWMLFLPYWAFRRNPPDTPWRCVSSIVDTWIIRTEERLLLRIFNRFQSESHPFLIHIYGPDGLTPLLTGWGKRHRVPVIYTEAGEADEAYVKTFYLQWTLEVINDIQLITCCSPLVAENIRRVYGYQGEIVTIPWLIAEPRESQLKSVRENGVVVVGSVGRLVEHKRNQDVIDALSRLRQRGHRVKFVVGGDGPMKERLREQAERLGVADAVDLLGRFDEVSDVMSLIDVFVLPSASEAQPLAISEAMSYGKPIIATKFGGIPDMVEDGSSGLLIAVNDLEALTISIEKLVVDQPLRQAMGRRSRELYLKNQKTDVVVDKVELAYTKLLARFNSN